MNRARTLTGRGQTGGLLVSVEVWVLTSPREPEAAVEVPLAYPTSTIYIDESGARASASRFFVVAAVKIRRHGEFMRAVKAVRDHTYFTREFKFSEINRGGLPAYFGLIDAVETADIRLAACVVDSNTFDPFSGGDPHWKVHAAVASQLLVGCINRRELVSVLMDVVSTPAGQSFEDTVRTRVNRRLGGTSIVSAVCLDSKASDGLQIADLIASSIAFEHRRRANVSGRANSNKAKVVNRLKAALGGVELCEGRSDRLNIATYRQPLVRRGRPPSAEAKRRGHAKRPTRLGSSARTK